MIPQPITIDGRSGTVVYLDDDWQPVASEQATLARVLFDDGGSAFYVSQPVAVAKYDPGQPRDPKGTSTGGQFAAGIASEPRLAEQAKNGIAAVEKLLPEAIKTAKFPEPTISAWSDLTDEMKQRVLEVWSHEVTKQTQISADEAESKFHDMNDAQKIDVVFRYVAAGLITGKQFEPAKHEVPEHWVTGAVSDEFGDQNYDRTHAIGQRLTELRTDELRKERGLLPAIEKPTYTVEQSKYNKNNFTIKDSQGNVVGASNTLEQAKLNAEELAESVVAKGQETSANIIDNVWESWKHKSSKDMGLSLQLAVAREFDGLHRMSPDEVREAEDAATAHGGIPTLQAYVRAQWEVTQMIMQKAGENKVDVYRAIMLPGEKVNKTTHQFTGKLGDDIPPPSNIKEKDLPNPHVSFDFAGEHFVEPRVRTQVKSILDLQPEGSSYEQAMAYAQAHPLEPVETTIKRRIDRWLSSYPGGSGYPSSNVFVKLSDIKLQRAGAQSTTGTRSVANDWKGVGDLPPDATRVVLRIEAPSTSVLSLPVYGKNLAAEHESVLMGTRDKWLWDAWRERAPDFNSQPVAHVVHKAETKPLTIDLQAEDRGKPHWLSILQSVAKPLTNYSPVLKWEESQHPRDPRGEFTRVAMTSQRGEGDPGHQSNKQVFSHMREFHQQLKALPGVSHVSVKPGVGGWEGGSESMWQIYYKGNGAARKLVAQTAKAFNQDAVLILNKCGGGKDCQPAVELSFEKGVIPAAREQVQKVLVAHGIGGWTWMKRDGKTLLRMVSVPQWGGEAGKHQQATADISKELRESGLNNHRHVQKVAVSVMEREGTHSYDSIIGA